MATTRTRPSKYLVCQALCTPVYGQLTFKKVEIRTAFAGVEQGDKGKLVIEKQRIRFTKNKGVAA